MFLRVVDKPDFGLEVFSPCLVSELTDVPACLSRLATITGLHHFCPTAKGTESALHGYESRVLVRYQLPDERSPRARIFVLGVDRAERLSVVSPHAAVAYPRAGRQDKFVRGVAIRDLIV
jgi:hypothetical protein